jgi:hypothetical protein
MLKIGRIAWGYKLVVTISMVQHHSHKNSAYMQTITMISTDSSNINN